MKKAGLMILASLFAFTFAMDAQTANQGKRQGKPAAARGEKFTPQQRADRMAKTLELTEAQRAKLAEFFTEKEAANAQKRAEFQQKRAQKQADNKAKREKMKAGMENALKARDAELEQIIGKEKMEKWNQLRKERRQAAKEKRGKAAKSE